MECSKIHTIKYFGILAYEIAWYDNMLFFNTNFLKIGKKILKQVGNDAKKFKIPETVENKQCADDIYPPGDDGEVFPLFFLKLKERC